MKKRAGSLLLVLALFIALLPAPVRAGALDSGLVYEIIGDHVVINEYTGNGTELTIPAEIDNLPVTDIGPYAFFTETLKRICIPASITDIGEDAFRDCSSLLEIRVDAANPYFSSDETGVLFNKAQTTLLRVPAARSGSYTVPDGVETIDIGFVPHLGDFREILCCHAQVVVIFMHRMAELRSVFGLGGVPVAELLQRQVIHLHHMGHIRHQRAVPVPKDRHGWPPQCI